MECRPHRLNGCDRRTESVEVSPAIAHFYHLTSSQGYGLAFYYCFHLGPTLTAIPAGDPTPTIENGALSGNIDADNPEGNTLKKRDMYGSPAGWNTWNCEHLSPSRVSAVRILLESLAVLPAKRQDELVVFFIFEFAQPAGLSGSRATRTELRP